ncbi:MAG: hypothetical protein K8L97_18710 [Anaerolineae bacterium]|nr:hypothetical protein [Anaerolineae bacterium]
MGHMLPHAFTAWGGLFFDLKWAVAHLLSILYQATPLPQKPKSGKTPRQSARNAEIKHKYEGGVSVPEIAEEYGVSINRVYQILGGKRK